MSWIVKQVNNNGFVCFLPGNSPASEFYMPTFRNTLFHLHRQVGKWFCSNHKTYAMSVYHPPTAKPTGDTHHSAEACGQVVGRNTVG
jgi:hypothetical protein